MGKGMIQKASPYLHTCPDVWPLAPGDVLAFFVDRAVVADRGLGAGGDGETSIMALSPEYGDVLLDWRRPLPCFPGRRDVSAMR